KMQSDFSEALGLGTSLEVFSKETLPVLDKYLFNTESEFSPVPLNIKILKHYESEESRFSALSRQREQADVAINTVNSWGSPYLSQEETGDVDITVIDVPHEYALELDG